MWWFLPSPMTCLMGLGAVAAGSAIKSLASSESYSDDAFDNGERENMKDILFESSKDGLSFIGTAYYNRTKGKYVAKISCEDIESTRWVVADNKEDLRKQIDEQYALNAQIYQMQHM